VFPAPLMSTIAELGAFLERESKAVGIPAARVDQPTGSTNGERKASDGQREAGPLPSAAETP
jgi:hypothetical protein